MTRLHGIVGSTRPGRAADRVVPWVLERARAEGELLPGSIRRRRLLAQARS